MRGIGEKHLVARNSRLFDRSQNGNATDISYNSSKPLEVCSDTPKLREPPKACRYQTDAERCLWQRLELWYGKNSQDRASSFEDMLKWAIRSQAPTSANDKDMEKVQRLNESGSESANH